MNRDRFTAIKAQLDSKNAEIERDDARWLHVVKKLRDALCDIRDIKHQPDDLGCRLAVEIARKALDDTAEWP